MLCANSNSFTFLMRMEKAIFIANIDKMVIMKNKKGKG